MKNQHIIPLLGAVVLALTNVPVSGADKVPPATIDEFKATGELADNVIAEHRGENYGFVITKSGFIRALHDASGKIIFDSIGDWVLQRNGTEHAGWINDQNTEASVSEGQEGSMPVYTVEVIHSKLLQKMTIACRESGPDITVEFEIVDFSNGEGINFPVKLNAKNVQSEQVDPAVNPVPFSTTDGRAFSIAYGSENFSPFGSKGNGTYRPNSLGMSLYPIFGHDKSSGATDSIALDIQMP